MLGAMKPPHGRESGAEQAEPWRGQPQAEARHGGAPAVTLGVAWSWAAGQPALPKGRPPHPGQPQPLSSAGGARTGGINLCRNPCQPCRSKPRAPSRGPTPEDEPELRRRPHPEDEPELGRRPHPEDEPELGGAVTGGQFAV